MAFSLLLLLLLSLGACGNEPTTNQQDTDVPPPAPPPVADAPVITASATPNPVAHGATSTVEWETAAATECSVTNGGNAAVATGTSGTYTTPPLMAETTYMIQCHGDGGSNSETVTITVSESVPPEPVIVAAATPNPVAYNASSTIAWSTHYAAGCALTISGIWKAGGINGTYETDLLTADTTYVLLCTGSGGDASYTETILVGSPPPDPVLTSFLADRNPAPYGGHTTISWAAQYATSCILRDGNGAYVASSSTATGSYTTPALTGDSVSYAIECQNTVGSVVTESIEIPVEPMAEVVIGTFGPAFSSPLLAIRIWPKTQPIAYYAAHCVPITITETVGNPPRIYLESACFDSGDNSWVWIPETIAVPASAWTQVSFRVQFSFENVAVDKTLSLQSFTVPPTLTTQTPEVHADRFTIPFTPVPAQYGYVTYSAYASLQVGGVCGLSSPIAAGFASGTSIDIAFAPQSGTRYCIRMFGYNFEREESASLSALSFARTKRLPEYPVISFKTAFVETP